MLCVRFCVGTRASRLFDLCWGGKYRLGRKTCEGESVWCEDLREIGVNIRRKGDIVCRTSQRHNGVGVGMGDRKVGYIRQGQDVSQGNEIDRK